MKKFLYGLLAAVLLMTNLAACAAGGDQAASKAETDQAKEEVKEAGDQSEALDNEGGDKLQIVTTIFPEYDWVRNILGEKNENAELTLLLNNGVDLHSYQPTADDILKISTCDLFIYVGGESDAWVDDALKEVINKDIKVINLLDLLGDSVKAEEAVEGMQETEHDHDHAHDEHSEDEHMDEHSEDEHSEEEHSKDEHSKEEHSMEEHPDEEEHEHEHEEGEAGANEDEHAEEEHDHDHEHEVEMDEHVWLSLRNAEVIIDSITEAIKAIDEGNGDVYEENAKAYKEKLEDLDKRYSEAAGSASLNTILFGDRFPFRYMVDDYGLNYYAAFSGCSAESEASFETITFLAGKVDELSLPVVLTIEGADHSIAETIVKSTKTQDQKILSLNSMQSVTSEDIENGADYLQIMEDNLKVLKEAIKAR
ncbi:MAG: metal ABC transporter substrate-binding protein [Lachnospiraceae bacterium]|nr:metal ABC transporter substrate-binding protein [Lachnospiraceae bacterium]